LEGNFVFDPTFEQEQSAKINLLVAGTLDAITMVESSAKEVSTELMMKALSFAFEIIKEMCHAQNAFIAAYKTQFGIAEVKCFYNLPDETAYDKVEAFLTDEKLEVLYGLGKKEFQYALDTLDSEVKEYFGITDENKDTFDFDVNSIGEMVYKRVKKVMRKNILKNEKRLDLRKLDEVRPIKCETGLLPRVHGSGLFQRGMTQILSVATLG
jgi:polyribonucleotide nucleotidyltransferase